MDELKPNPAPPALPLPVLTGDERHRAPSDVSANDTATPPTADPSPNFDSPTHDDRPRATPATLFAALPRTAYVWFAILLLTYLLPLVADNPLRRAKRAANPPAPASAGVGSAPVTAPLNDKEFSTFLSAESQTRVAYAARAFFDAADGAKPEGVQSAGIGTLKQVVADYRKLATSTGAPNMARKVLILQNQRSQPFDKTYLEKNLVANLRKSGVAPAQIADERRLWSQIYARDGKTLPKTRSIVADVEKIKAMKLRFLEAQALADLHESANQTREASRYRAILSKSASASAGKLLVVNGTILLAFLVGVVIFVVYLVAVFSKRWTLVKRVATQPQRVGWPAMLDAFLFYLAFMRGGSWVFGLALVAIVPDPTVAAEIGAQFAFSLIAGLAFIAYLAHSLKRSGATLSDVGFRAVGRHGIWAEIGYGIVGYCATLPPFLLFQLASRALFDSSTNTSPNPAFPLMTSAAENPMLSLLMFGLVAVFAPVFEECAFRGAFFSGLRARLIWPVAVVISAGFFAVLHPPQDWIGIFLLGCSFATMREMRQSVYPGITAHLMQNSFAFFATSIIFGS